MREKPGKESRTVGQVVERLKASQNIEISMEDFAGKCVEGYTFVPSHHMDNKKSNDSWLYQNILCLDFDNNLPLEAAIQRLEDYDLYPAFIYSTLSDTPECSKYRIVFKLNFICSDEMVRNILVKSFEALFTKDELDYKCFDKARFFYGGKDLLYENYDKELSLIQLIKSTQKYLIGTFLNDKNQRALKKYYQEANLIKRGSSLMHDIVDVGEDSEIYRGLMSNGYYLEKCAPYKALKDEESVNFSKITFKVYIGDHAPLHTQTGGGGASIIALYLQEQQFTTKRNAEFVKIKSCRGKKVTLKNTDYSKCQLLDLGRNTSEHLCHDEMWHLMSNLSGLCNGKELFDKILRKRLKDETDKWYKEWIVSQWNNAVDNYTYHSSCSKWGKTCRFHDECPHNKGTIIDTLKNKHGEVKIVDMSKEMSFDKDIQDVEKEMRKTYREILNSDNKDIHIIKAPTGIGKTQILIDHLDEYKQIIGFPNHKIKSEVADRIERSGLGIHFAVTPHMKDYIPEDSNEFKKIQRLYDIGAYSKVYSYGTNIKSDGDGDIQGYFKKLNESIETEHTLLTTHSRILMSHKLGTDKDTIVFDEDPIDILISEKRVWVKDIITLKNELEDYKANSCSSVSDYDLLMYLINEMEEKPDGIVFQNQNKKLCQKELLESLSEHSAISTNVLDFLRCDFWIKDQKRDYEGNPLADRQIVCRTCNRLPKKKIIIFSATSNPDIYKAVYPDRTVHVYDFSGVKPEGTIIQYTNKGFSKSVLKTKDGLEYAEEMIHEIDPDGEMPIITTKDKVEYFRNQGRETMYFGALAGLDSFKGKDIIVIGTPHLDEASYLLLGSILGKKIHLTEKAHYQSVEYNNRFFKFRTYGDNEDLQKIQMWMIERELLQAVGRARTLRESCTVYLLSNLPIVGAEYRTYCRKKKAS